MTDFMLNDSNDLHVGADFALTPDQTSAVKQLITIELKTILGEWFLDQNKGLPFFSELLGKSPNKHYLETLFRNALLAIPEVNRVHSLEVTFIPNSRTAAVNFVVGLHNGASITVEQLEAPIV
jgi:hypothetical protein